MKCIIQKHQIRSKVRTNNVLLKSHEHKIKMLKTEIANIDQEVCSLKNSLAGLEEANQAVLSGLRNSTLIPTERLEHLEFLSALGDEINKAYKKITECKQRKDEISSQYKRLISLSDKVRRNISLVNERILNVEDEEITNLHAITKAMGS